MVRGDTKTILALAPYIFYIAPKGYRKGERVHRDPDFNNNGIVTNSEKKVWNEYIYIREENPTEPIVEYNFWWWSMLASIPVLALAVMSRIGISTEDWDEIGKVAQP